MIQAMVVAHFNPRSPHGERLSYSMPFFFAALFQPTLPARGATCAELYREYRHLAFQPTLPARGATWQKLASPLSRLISTHAPRTGSDAGANAGSLGTGDFNPRSPHGERPAPVPAPAPAPVFQPTLPARGATGVIQLDPTKLQFQPTLPARGATDFQNVLVNNFTNFNPRSPHGERPMCTRWRATRPPFQPTLPARGATFQKRERSRFPAISTHAPRTGSDPLVAVAQNPL